MVDLVAGLRLIFADEPTGALDTVNGEHLLQALLGAARETGQPWSRGKPTHRISEGRLRADVAEHPAWVPQLVAVLVEPRVVARTRDPEVESPISAAVYDGAATIVEHQRTGPTCRRLSSPGGQDKRSTATKRRLRSSATTPVILPAFGTPDHRHDGVSPPAADPYVPNRSRGFDGAEVLSSKTAEVVAAPARQIGTSLQPKTGRSLL